MFITHDYSDLVLLILDTPFSVIRECYWLYALSGCLEPFNRLKVNISSFTLLSPAVATIQQRVRNVWHNHCTSSLRGKKHKEDTEKADVLLWQPHCSGSWREDSKSLSSHQSLICLRLKQRNESGKTRVEGKVNIWHHDDVGLIGQAEVVSLWYFLIGRHSLLQICFFVCDAFRQWAWGFPLH